MFKRRTLFVVGAGASAEVNFPVGTQLASIIGQKADIRFEEFNKPVGKGDIDLFVQLTRQLTYQADEYQKAGCIIRDGVGYSQSIDDFLDQHRSNDIVNLFGKAAIVKAILEAEKKSKLYIDPAKSRGPAPDDWANTWFVKFMQILTRGIAKEDVDTVCDNVSFIVFNYDRCVEHFLAYALSRSYDIYEDHAMSIVSKTPVIHPYGLVSRQVPFGQTSVNYFEQSKGIKTYTEQIHSPTVARIQDEIKKAECIVFLGFAYRSPNLPLLTSGPSTPRPIFGTAWGMSDADVQVVRSKLRSSFAPQEPDSSPSLQIDNKLKAAGLFDHYAMSLAGGD